jgi:hypothetical protein
MTFRIIDNFLDNPDEHLSSIMSGEFIDFDSNVGVFKNIQDRKFDLVSYKLLNLLPNTSVAYNFARMSPEGQEEPTFVHDDSMMGDFTCILYLSKEYPEEDGTTIYDEDYVTKCVEFRSKFNRMVIFDSNLPHSRNIFSNFGVNESSRLIQVIFLNNN